MLGKYLGLEPGSEEAELGNSISCKVKALVKGINAVTELRQQWVPKIIRGIYPTGGRGAHGPDFLCRLKFGLRALGAADNVEFGLELGRAQLEASKAALFLDRPFHERKRDKGKGQGKSKLKGKKDSDNQSGVVRQCC